MEATAAATAAAAKTTKLDKHPNVLTSPQHRVLFFHALQF